MKLKELTDLKVAEFCGVTNRTLQYWKKPQEINGVKFHPPIGKHNLYIGARLATYLLMSKELEDGTEEINNNLENMLLSIEKAEKLINVIKTECKSKYLQDLEEEIKFLKEKMQDLEELSRLD